MVSWLRRWLHKQFDRERLVIVEVERPRFPSDLGPETKEAVASLTTHPGFCHLMAKLRFQRSALEGQLKSASHPDMRSVDMLQARIAACRWLESQVDSASKQEPARQDATDVERKLFEEIRGLIEPVGF